MSGSFRKTRPSENETPAEVDNPTTQYLEPNLLEKTYATRNKPKRKLCSVEELAGSPNKIRKQMLCLPPLGGFGWERKDAQNTSSMYFPILVHPT